MTGIMPEGEGIRKSVRWISSMLQDNPDLILWKLEEEAITRFDLNPFEAEKLLQFYRDNKTNNT
ncbi:MAG TPA: hypothetical protein PLP19_09665 [bacterium]|nr:hypothetical protein [bacterium]HPN43744.1 hypothetical protein [bacterium]